MSNKVDVYYNVSERKIFLAGDVEEANTREIIWGMYEMEKEEPRDPIDFIIHTDGGELDGFFAIYDTMRNLKCPVNTFSLGKAYSAGAFLLMSGTGLRSAYKNSWIMIHEFSGGAIGRFTYMDQRHDYLVKTNQRLAELITIHTKQPIDKILQDLKKDLYLTPEEAKEYGMIDQII
jgi:ATP-dependent Clp protease protease subunit